MKPPLHPLSAVFPRMEGKDFDDLVASIQKHGQLEPITMIGKEILDGANRWMACQCLGIVPKTVPFTGDDPVAFVVAKNVDRRHLTEAQRSMIAGRLADMKHGGDRRSGQFQGLNLILETGGVSAAEAAKLLKVGRSSVNYARTVLRNGDPSLIAAVDAGRLGVSSAAEVAKEPPAAQQAKVADLSAERTRRAKPKPVPTPAPEPLAEPPPEPADVTAYKRFVNETLIPAWEKKTADLKRFCQTIADKYGYMPEEVFKTLRASVHPDWSPPERMERNRKAFDWLNENKTLILGTAKPPEIPANLNDALEQHFRKAGVRR